MIKNYLQKARDPISSLTHFYGAVISVLGLCLLLFKSITQPQPSLIKIISSALFGLSLVALYTASSVYHFVNVSDKALLVLRKLDHSMIFVLIAGTYTPIMLNFLPSPNNIFFTIFIWAFAFGGIIMKLCWFGAPRWLQTCMYLIMGWAVLVDVSVFTRMSGLAIVLLIMGGLSYTAGGIIYMIKKPNIGKRFGFHELFHIFVLLGSVFHFFLVYLCVI
ncbi:MAG: hemolysin III family protein [Hydrogenoanaerobacterium sp.]